MVIKTEKYGYVQGLEKLNLNYQKNYLCSKCKKVPDGILLIKCAEL